MTSTNIFLIFNNSNQYECVFSKSRLDCEVTPQCQGKTGLYYLKSKDLIELHNEIVNVVRNIFVKNLFRKGWS